jgi:hypothetical protein
MDMIGTVPAPSEGDYAIHRITRNFARNNHTGREPVEVTGRADFDGLHR